MKKHGISLIVAVFILVVAVSGAQAITEIHWWHAMGGALGMRVDQITDNFNLSQNKYKLIANYKGNYTETMTAGIAAFRAGKQPHLIQVFEVGTATMMGAKGAIKPVYQLMAETGAPFDPAGYVGAVKGYYTTADGKMLSMPFNSSTPVLFYNKDAFKKAGLDPDKPPKTWPEVGQVAKKLVDSGAVKYGFSTCWPSWVQIENFGPWHNLPIGTKGNGFEGLDTEFVFNSPLFVKHIQQLADWQKDKIFIYAGRGDDANPMFPAGDLGMMTQSSAAHAGYLRNSDFEFGVSNLPYWPDTPGAPLNTIIGGASLWVFQGHTAEEYKAVAAFFSFLSLPMVQGYWHENTGYVPITTAAMDMMKDLGFYKRNPGRDLPIMQLNGYGRPATAYSKGLRFGSFLQERVIIEEEMENIFAGKKTAKQGLDDAVKRANVLLRRFEKANK